MAQKESNNVNATQDDIGTTGIELICLLCGKVPKVRDTTFRGYQSLLYLLAESGKQTKELSL